MKNPKSKPNKLHVYLYLNNRSVYVNNEFNYTQNKYIINLAKIDKICLNI